MICNTVDEEGTEKEGGGASWEGALEYMPVPDGPQTCPPPKAPACAPIPSIYPPGAQTLAPSSTHTCLLPTCLCPNIHNHFIATHMCPRLHVVCQTNVVTWSWDRKYLNLNCTLNNLVWRASMWSVVMISPHQDCTIQVGVQTCDPQLLDICWNFDQYSPQFL